MDIKANKFRSSGELGGPVTTLDFADLLFAAVIVVFAASSLALVPTFLGK